MERLRNPGFWRADRLLPDVATRLGKYLGFASLCDRVGPERDCWGFFGHCGANARHEGSGAANPSCGVAQSHQSQFEACPGDSVDEPVEADDVEHAREV